MAYQKIPGLAALGLPDDRMFLTFTGNGFTSGSTLLDATGEQVIYCGDVIWSDHGSHPVRKIGWRSGGSATWATAGSTVTVGIQGVHASAGPVVRPDGTWQASKALVQGTDTIASNTFYETQMTSDSASIANGTTICVVIEMTTRNGADQVNVDSVAVANGQQFNQPSVTGFLSAAYTNQNSRTPNVTLVADDGTYGTLHGAFPFATAGTAVTAFNNASATKEYGNLFTLPFNCKIIGGYAAFSDQNTVATADFSLYTDPTALGAGPTSVASGSFVSRSGIGVTNNKLTYWVFSSPYTYTANTLMAMAVKPTSASNIGLSYFEVNANAAWDCHPLGTGCYSVSRGTVGTGTALATFGSTSRRMIMGLLMSHFDDGAGGSGTTIAGTPMMRGMVA